MAPISCIPLGGVVELPDRELADALEQLVAGRTVDARLGRDHRLVDQPRDHVQHVELVDLTVGGHPLGRLETEIRGERAEAAKDRAFTLIEEIVAPFDGPQQGLLAMAAGAFAGGEDSESFVQTESRSAPATSISPARRRVRAPVGCRRDDDRSQ